MTNDVNEEGTSPRRWIIFLLVGCGAVVGGLVAGATRLETIGYDCGSVFAPHSQPGIGLDRALIDEFCKDERGSRVAITWLLLLIGATLATISTFRLSRFSRISRIAVPSLPAQLRDLEELRDSGALTEKEFTAAKRRLLRDNEGNA